MASATRRQQYGDAVEKLKKYINGTSSEDFVSLVLTGQSEADANTFSGSISPEIQALKSIVSPVIDVINGGYFTHELTAFFSEKLNSNNISKINADLLARSIRFTPQTTNIWTTKGSIEQNLIDNGIINGTNSLVNKPEKQPETYGLDKCIASIEISPPDFKNPKKEATPINVIEILNSQLGTAVRDTTGLAIFASAVPAHIMSRAVPYVSVKVHGVKGYENNQGISTSENLSLLRYLKGKYKLSSENIFDATLLGFNNNKVTTPASMEAFTAPQTLVADLSDVISQNFAGVNPIDRFRPLMTLTSITFDVAPSGAGFISFKTGKINLVLHDRGRLSEVAAFVQAQLYSVKELEIEYGWSIDTSSGRLATNAEISNGLAKEGQRVYGGRVTDDVFAQFVDSLRVTEKYIIVNSEFSFDDAGQVNIGLSISLKGGKEINAYEVTADATKKARDELKQLITDIGNLLSQGNVKDVLSESFLGAVASEDSILALNSDEVKKLRDEISKISKQNTTADTKALSDKINSTLQKSTATQNVSAQAVDAMFARFNGFEIFPASSSVIAAASTAKANGAGLGIVELSSGDYQEGSISLGSALTVFICQPLQQQKRFDEIQLIFNKFNDRASYMRSLSIAAFPLDKKKLIEAVKKLYTKSSNVSVSQVVNLVGSFVESINHPAYGFSGAYDKEGKLKESGGLSLVETQLKKAGISDGRFQLPKLSVNFECVPHWKNREQTILRIHVTDSQASPFQEHSEAITAGRSDTARFVELGGIETSHPLFRGFVQKDLDAKNILSQRIKNFDQMIKEGVLKKVEVATPTIAQSPNDKIYSINLADIFTPSKDPKQLKNFLKRGLPTISYGNAGGLVKSISVSSINDARLATVNTLRAQESVGDAPGTSKQSGLPLLVNGTEVQVEMLGCPILNFGQSFYIDMGTNTSIDNIYVCTGLSHKIEPGQFTTSAKFTLNVGAYGIYSSAKREFAVLGSIARNFSPTSAGSTVVEPDGTPEKPYLIFRDIKLDNIISQADLGSKLKENPKVIRIWRNDSGGPLFITKGFQKTKFLGDDNSVQISENPKIGEVVEAFKGIGTTSFVCYEFTPPKVGSEKIIQGKLYTIIGGEIRNTSIQIDLENLPELLKTAPTPARAKKKVKSPPASSDLGESDSLGESDPNEELPT